MTSRPVRPRLAACGFALVLFLAARPLPAQEIQWRNDYQAARQEAKAKSRPIVMDFGTANCFWCKKLDASTFRDPAIIRLLGEQFIPVKIDAEREATLTQQLNIHSFPTLVFAAPDGRILGRHAGYVDAAQFGQQLRRALNESMPATSLAETAAKESTAPPSSAGSSAVSGRLAVCLLARAQDDFRRGQFALCLECCQVLVAIYPDLPQTEDARRLMQQIKGDPQAAPQASAQLAEQLADLYLDLAQAAAKQNRSEQAAACWQRAVQVCPGSAQARTAQSQLARMRPSLVEQSVRPTTVRGQSP